MQHNAFMCVLNHNGGNVKGEPGYFIELNELSSMLTKKAYGLMELVDLGLFHSEHYARDAVLSGKLEGCKINNTQYSFDREDILSYWEHYRSEEYDPNVFPMTVNLNSNEISFIVKLYNEMKEFLPNRSGYDDLIRSMINYFKEEKNVHKLLIS